MADEKEILAKEVRTDGVGEDPSVQAFIKKFAEASPQKALEILSAMQKHLTGQSDLENPRRQEKVMVLKAKAEDLEAAENAWKEDQVKFVQHLYDKNPPPIGDEAERLKVKAAAEFQAAMQKHSKSQIQKQAMFDDVVKNGPKETINVTGYHENINGRMRLMPEVLRIMHRTFVLQPGQHTVPQVVAEAYRNVQNLRDEREARRNAMKAEDGAGLEYAEFAKRQKQLDLKFSKSDFTGGLGG